MGTYVILTLYELLAWIDYFVYSLAAVIIRIIEFLANKDNILSTQQIETFVNRVYVVVGVLVLFKLVISAVQYMINPDSFEDKDKGVGEIMKRFAISILLVLVTPALFSFLVSIQSSVISTLPNIIFGNSTVSLNEKKDTASNLSFMVLSSFVEVRDGKSAPGNAKMKDLESFRKNILNGCDTRGILGSNGKEIAQLVDWIRSFFGENVDSLESCTYNYMIIISTIAGGFFFYMLLSIALDTAIRTIKFTILRLLAPIPIVGYVFKKDRLSKFGKVVATVYLDLFIRMGIVYFIIFMISEIFSRKGIEVVNGGNAAGRNFLLGGIITGLKTDFFFNAICNVVLIFGLLMFAKSAPKFISELLGLPDIGSGDLADMFKPAWQRAGGAAGALINPAANAVANYRQAKALGRSNGEALRRAAAGFGRGAADSVQGVMAGDDWGKMKNRLDASKKRSLDRAITARNRDNNAKDGERRRSYINDKIDKLKSKLAFKDDPSIQKEAEANYNRDQARLKKMGDAYQKALDEGKFKTEEQKQKAFENYNKLKSRLANKDEYINNEKRRIQAQRDRAAEVANYNDKIKNNNDRITKLHDELSKGGLSFEERMTKENELKRLGNENRAAVDAIENITKKKALDASRKSIDDNRNRISEIDSILAGNTVDSVISSCNTNAATIRQNYANRISSIDAQLGQAGLTVDQRTTLEASKASLIRERDAKLHEVDIQRQDHITALQQEKTNREATVVTAQKEIANISGQIQTDINKRVSEYVKTEAELTKAYEEKGKIERQIEMVNEGIRASGWRGDIDAYFGGTPVSGKGYSELSNLLGQTRGAIFTGEAMTKMRQNADILVDENNDPIQFKSNYILGGEGGKTITYQDMLKIYTHATTSGLTQEDRKTMAGIGLDENLIESAWKEIEKKAAALYVTANVEAIVNPSHEVVSPGDPRYVDTTFGGEFKHVRLKRGAPNSAIQEWWSTFADRVGKSGVPSEEIGKLLEQFKANPGDFIAKASEAHDLYSIVGKKIVDTQSSDGGKK